MKNKIKHFIDEIGCTNLDDYTAVGILKDIKDEFSEMYGNIKERIDARIEEYKAKKAKEDELTEDETEIKEDLELYKYDYINEEYYDKLSDEEKDSINKKLLNHCVRMSPVEYLRVKKFIEEHRDSCNQNGQCSVHFHYEVAETGIGTNIRIFCENCKKCADVTDYESW